MALPGIMMFNEAMQRAFALRMLMMVCGTAATLILSIRLLSRTSSSHPADVSATNGPGTTGVTARLSDPPFPTPPQTHD